MQNLDPKTVAMIQIAENSIAKIHDDMLTRFIVETMLSKGSVDIEEAQFYNELSKKILNESSHLFIPDVKELMENVVTSLEEDARVLVDPETGDKFVYYPDTGELTPATDDDVAGLESDDADEDIDDADNDIADADEDDADADKDIAAAMADQADANKDMVDADEDPVTRISDSDEDVSASNSPRKKELNENSLLVKQLLSTLKEL